MWSLVCFYVQQFCVNAVFVAHCVCKPPRLDVNRSVRRELVHVFVFSCFWNVINVLLQFLKQPSYPLRYSVFNTIRLTHQTVAQLQAHTLDWTQQMKQVLPKRSEYTIIDYTGEQIKAFFLHLIQWIRIYLINSSSFWDSSLSICHI